MVKAVIPFKACINVYGLHCTYVRTLPLKSLERVAVLQTIIIYDYSLKPIDSCNYTLYYINGVTNRKQMKRSNRNFYQLFHSFLFRMMVGAPNFQAVSSNAKRIRSGERETIS